MNETEIIITADGSHSLFNKALNETYHSIHGAVGESKHVFIQNGLDFFCQRTSQKQINILEVGFGTGLNALLSLQYIANHAIDINYTTLEAYPLEKEIWSSLNYADSIESKHHFELMHTEPWAQWNSITSNFQLFKINQTLQQVELPSAAYDLIFFDAFAPSKQPDMWIIEMLEKVVKSMAPNSIFVTYCAKGQLKRDLKTLGLQVETLQGPPGKHEMIRGVKS